MTTTPTEGQYLFPHTWEGEGDRLNALATLLDPVTRRHLTALGLGPGWRCLEVGGGTGSVARWLAETVGDTGHVLATDLSLDLMKAQGVEESATLELRIHDIVHDPMPEGRFDLIHSRLVLEHLPARVEVLAKLAGALAPGGWLVIEDMCLRGHHATDRRGALTISALFRLIGLVLAQHGHDGRWGARLPVHMHRAGLTGIGAEGTQIMMIGDSPAVRWVAPNLARMRTLLVEDNDVVTGSSVQKVLAAVPPLKGVLKGRLDRLEGLLADPEFVYVAPTFVTAWGRKPA